MRGYLKSIICGNADEQYLTFVVSEKTNLGLMKGQEVNLEVRKWYPPRSLDANAYFHVLVNRIAAAIDTSDDEVKRLMNIRYGTLRTDCDGNIMAMVLPADEDVSKVYPYFRLFRTLSIGEDRYNCYLLYKRTHNLNKAEMAHLIDGTISEAKDLGVDTDTPESLNYREGGKYRDRF